VEEIARVIRSRKLGGRSKFCVGLLPVWTIFKDRSLAAPGQASEIEMQTNGKQQRGHCQKTRQQEKLSGRKESGKRKHHERNDKKPGESRWANFVVRFDLLFHN
jgi:hypothetical protein